MVRRHQCDNPTCFNGPAESGSFFTYESNSTRRSSEMSSSPSRLVSERATAAFSGRWRVRRLSPASLYQLTCLPGIMVSSRIIFNYSPVVRPMIVCLSVCISRGLLGDASDSMKQWRINILLKIKFVFYKIYRGWTMKLKHMSF